MDPNSPFEIFVRELVAMDGVDSSEITLIDSDGCPTDHFIMGPLYKSDSNGKVYNKTSYKFIFDVLSSHDEIRNIRSIFFFTDAALSLRCLQVPVVRSRPIPCFGYTLYAQM